MLPLIFSSLKERISRNSKKRDFIKIDANVVAGNRKVYKIMNSDYWLIRLNSTCTIIIFFLVQFGVSRVESDVGWHHTLIWKLGRTADTRTDLRQASFTYENITKTGEVKWPQWYLYRSEINFFILLEI